MVFVWSKDKNKVLDSGIYKDITQFVFFQVTVSVHF